MITLAPKQTTGGHGDTQNSLPDDAQPTDAYVAVVFDGTHYVFYEPVDTLPARLGG
jgi:hypothetical protein